MPTSTQIQNMQIRRGTGHRAQNKKRVGVGLDRPNKNLTKPTKTIKNAKKGK